METVVHYRFHKTPLTFRPVTSAQSFNLWKQWFVTVFTTAQQMSLSYATLTQFVAYHSVSLRSVLILSSHLHLGLSFRFSNLIPVRISLDVIQLKMLTSFTVLCNSSFRNSTLRTAAQVKGVFSQPQLS